MSTSIYMQDQDFDALVDGLHMLAQSPETADRWEIRVLLARHGLLPLRVASVPSMEDSLAASLRSLCERASAGRERRAA